MNKFINENLLKMNTEEFLSNIKKAFNDVFSNGNIEKINLMNYLSEKKWLSIKKWTFTAFSARKIWRKKK